MVNCHIGDAFHTSYPLSFVARIGRNEERGAIVMVNSPMLFSRHVYSTCSVRQVAATALAFSSLRCSASLEAMEEVSRIVP